MPKADLSVRLTPRASRDEIGGLRDGTLLVRVCAPAVDDRANVALCKLLARAAGVAPSRVAIVRGARSRDKRVIVEGIERDALLALLLA